jgi:ElaB/YqjD/DUF883 family membrane-anchored ribosome-binding protein
MGSARGLKSNLTAGTYPAPEVEMDTSELGSTVRQLEDRVEDQIKDVSRRVQTVGERVVDMVREHPAAALVGAFAVGYLIARVARR